VQFCHTIGWLVLTIGLVLPASLYGEEEVGISYTEEASDAKRDLSFETAFETKLGLAHNPNVNDVIPPITEEKFVVGIKSPTLKLPPSSELSLSRIQDLRNAGALSLAESLLIAGLSAREVNIDRFSWHKVLWEVRDEKRDYQSLIESLEELVGQVTGEQLFEVLERLARTHQKNGDFIAARAGVRVLLLMKDTDPVRVARLRRLLIQNYVDAGLLEDAESASMRYQEEYLPDDTQWNLLRGQILVENGEPSKAVVQLVGLQDQKARLMLALARLNEGSMDPDSVIRYLEVKDKLIVQSEELDWFRMGIICEAARLADSPRIRARMLESLLAAGVKKIPMFPEFDPVLLLEAYTDVAMIEGNESHLLLGNDKDWVEYAAALPVNRNDIARAIYALLLQNQPSDAVAKAANEGLIELLLNEDRYGVVVALYSDEGPFGQIPEVDEALLLRFSRIALDRADYSIAVDIAKTLRVTPTGITKWSWQLQVARLEIFAGKSQDGARRLLSILGDAEDLDEKQLDQLLQVVFDLQTISRHDLALEVFQEVGQFTRTLRQRRELLFWMGESQIGQQRYAQGADLFLQSAEEGSQQGDLWGQSARFRAAEALVDARLFEDAFNIYQILLLESQDKNRQFQLRQKLQEINLRRAVGRAAGL